MAIYWKLKVKQYSKLVNRSEGCCSWKLRIKRSFSWCFAYSFSQSIRSASYRKVLLRDFCGDLEEFEADVLLTDEVQSKEPLATAKSRWTLLADVGSLSVDSVVFLFSPSWIELANSFESPQSKSVFVFVFSCVFEAFVSVAFWGVNEAASIDLIVLLGAPKSEVDIVLEKVEVLDVEISASFSCQVFEMKYWVRIDVSHCLSWLWESLKWLSTMRNSCLFDSLNSFKAVNSLIQSMLKRGACYLKLAFNRKKVSFWSRMNQQRCASSLNTKIRFCDEPILAHLAENMDKSFFDCTCSSNFVSMKLQHDAQSSSTSSKRATIKTATFYWDANSISLK